MLGTVCHYDYDYNLRPTLSCFASIETLSLNFDKHTRISCTFAAASGSREKLRVTMLAEAYRYQPGMFRTTPVQWFVALAGQVTFLISRRWLVR